MHSFLQAAHDAWLGGYARTHAWVFTTGLVLHFIGLCVLLGAMLVVDLRVLGLGREVPVGAVMKLLPVAIAGFLVNLATGAVFFVFDPFGYWQNPGFRIKLVLLLLAGLNALAFTLGEHRRAVAAGPGYDAGVLSKASAALSLFLWFAIILFGRLIVAFQGSPDLFK
jgi:hypothetical protein